MQSNQQQHGFTLIELMVVVAIIGLLGSIVAVNVMQSHEDAMQATAKADLLRLHDTVAMYQLKHHQRPDDLVSLVSPDPKGRIWLSGFESTPRDPWGQDYILQAADDRSQFEVVSWGPDGIESTEDDLTSRNARDK